MIRNGNRIATVVHPVSPPLAGSSGGPSARIGTCTHYRATVIAPSTPDCALESPNQKILGNSFVENVDDSSEHSSNPAADLAEHAIQVTDWLGDLPGVTDDRAMRKLAIWSIDWAAEELWVNTGVPPHWETCRDAEDLLVARGWTILRTREEDAARRRGRYDFYSE